MRRGRGDEVEVIWLPIALRLGSLASIVACWKDDRKYYDQPEIEKRMDWLDLEGTDRVRQVHLHPKQIPIAGTMDWDLDRLLLDFVPGPKGREGQVIARYDVDFRFVADSFGALLNDVATRLESGETAPYRM